MNPWQWIKDHPQRTASLLLGAFGSVQVGMVALQSAMSPLVVGIVNIVFSIVMGALAWAVKNLKDKEPIV